MQDWKQILYDIYTPEIGALWAAQNMIWTNSFAQNKPRTDNHPSVVGKVSSCKTVCLIIPGTSKGRVNSCVFKVKLKENDPNCSESYFLISLWMSYSKSELLKLRRGWDGIDILNQNQVSSLKLQIKYCNGINV